MTITLYYRDGTTITLTSVQTVTLAGAFALDVQTFGNDVVRHYNVLSFTTDGFNFEEFVR